MTHSVAVFTCAQVKDLLIWNRDVHPWPHDSRSLGTIADALTSVRNGTVLTEDEVKVLKLAYLVRTGWELNAIAVDANRILGGFHRFLAYVIAKRSVVHVADFSTTAGEGLKSIPDPVRKSLQKVVQDHLLIENTLMDIRKQFQTSAKYSRCQLLNIFSEPLLNQCLFDLEQMELLLQHTSWYNQKSVVVTPEVVSQITNVSPGLGSLLALLLSDEFRALIAFATGNILISKPKLVVQKMQSQDHIGIHNDFEVEGPRVRCVFYVTGPGKDIRGGDLQFFADSEGKTVLDVYRPENNSMVMFHISTASFHQVRPVQLGTRYSLILSYREDLKS